MIEDDGFETVVGLQKKKTYSVEVEGVVTRVFRVEAESSARASELARSEFIVNLGGNKDAVFVNDVWKD
jgi:hypothetical protein